MPGKPRHTQLTLPIEHFHEPRREDCPWCGSTRLRPRKQGAFTLDECVDCAHAFQNPRLTAEGREHHRRALAAPPGVPMVRHLRATARAILPFPEPESWLDVGTGTARFPKVAKEVFPYTSFDGIDPGHRLERAWAAERVEEAHVGHLTTPEITARLRARYDVVSMLHHLERTHDPRAELHAALTALRPGGHLLLELTNPRSTFASLLGKWWHPHTQPTHLHLIPPANLLVELEYQGCTIVTLDRHAPHTPTDLTKATVHALARILPTPATAPFTVTAALLDHTLAPVLRHTAFSNAYRLIARKPNLAGA
ncbi:class I SAM-dependent methyltransferase [Streptomyces griseus]|uniref:class I SAM-dependent methyltransferase n=1 Tax=Streptomyces griseus TaxID=1911 RepID=UPI0005644F0B|nr:class I SAM-dependent methyltransferase [Streptomyces griseus]